MNHCKCTGSELPRCRQTGRCKCSQTTLCTCLAPSAPEAHWMRRGIQNQPGNMSISIFVLTKYFHNFHCKMSQLRTWGLAVAREAMASREARVAAILYFVLKSLDCERLVLGRFELRYWRKTAIWCCRQGSLLGFPPSSLNSRSPTPRVSPLPQASAG